MRCWTLRPLLDSPFLASFLVFVLVRRLVGRLREGVLPLASLASLDPQQPAEFAPRGGHHPHLSSLQKCAKARENFKLRARWGLFHLWDTQFLNFLALSSL